MKRPYGYGIIDRNGNAWWDEACVCKDREPLLEVVENLNEEWRSSLRSPFRVVRLFWQSRARRK